MKNVSNARRHLRSLARGGLISLALATACAGASEPRPLLAPPFQPHAVLQRGKPIPVWGWARAGEAVSVSLAGHTVTATADATGRWMAKLPPLEAGGPYSLRASTKSGATQSADDVLIGDVWLCSGQSNMVLQVKRTLNSRSEIENAHNDSIRMLTVPLTTSAAPLDTFRSTVSWERTTPGTVPEFSATCFYFARELQKTVHVPMGLINSSWGGSKIQAWMSAEALHRVGGYDESLELLDLSRRDGVAANQRWGEMWQKWWRAHASPPTEPWAVDAAKSGHWRVAPHPLTSPWEQWGVPELADYNGIVWYRTTLDLTSEQAAQRASLSLGPIDEVDETWVNGKAIGSTSGAGTDRTYDLPKGLLHAGVNTVVIAVLDTYAAGGIYGPLEKRALHLANGTSIPLDREWQYQIAPANVGPVPRAPWEAVAGLGVIYNAMIAPLEPYALRGVLWYQGESNTDEADQYEALLAALMADWRAKFAAAELPFLIVQLANYGPASTEPVDSDWARLREAQRLAVAHDAHAALAVAVDIGNRYDIHPANKQELGRRLARAARHVVYGEAVAPSGPVARSARRVGDRIEVEFTDVDGQLLIYGSNRPVGFEVCAGQPASCRFVDAMAEKTRIWLEPGAGPAPDRVRFCWADSPVCNVYDRSGLPAGPFELPIH